jgi:hypothetical protein
LSVKNMFHLSNHAAEEYVDPLFNLLGVQLQVPDHYCSLHKNLH